MSPSDARVVLLRAEVRRDWSAVLDHRARADSVDPGDSEPNAAFVAMALHHAYQAFETLLLRLERSLGLPGRDGERWHERILEDACLDLPDLRPAIIDPSAVRAWHELRRFRHFLRHAYTAQLDPSKLCAVRDHLATATAQTAPRIAALEEALSA